LASRTIKHGAVSWTTAAGSGGEGASLLRWRRLGNRHNETDFQYAALAHIYYAKIAVDLYNAILALTGDVIFTPHQDCIGSQGRDLVDRYLFVIKARFE
jgi:hypothetical protein